MSRRSGRPPTCSSIVRDAIGRAPRVGDPHHGDGAVADRDPLGLERPLDVEREAADDERQGDDEHDQAAGGDDHQLDPAEQPAGDVGERRRGRRRSSRSPSTGSAALHRRSRRRWWARTLTRPRWWGVRTLTPLGASAAGSSTAVEELVDERRPCVDPAQLGLGREQHAVAHHGRGDDAHVVGGDERPGLRGGQRPRRADQGDRPAGRHAEPQLRAVTRVAAHSRTT